MTWNREHLFPKHWLNLTSSQVSNSYHGVASDLFEVAPSNPSVNSSRGDYGYGYYPYSGSYGANSDGSDTYWYPGNEDRGDIARAMFYMATRYGQNQTNNLSLINGTPQLYQMGDLNSLLHWNYDDGVDNFERRRNEYTYSSALNPTYYQGNRNPYIDHPEYVWAIFGTEANNSQIHVGSSVNSDGSSSQNVSLGRVIKNSALPSANVAITKTGYTPTTYDVLTSGEATSPDAGTGHPFRYDADSKTISVSLSGSTATAGLKSGTITIDNTDLTTAAAGQGSADQNDTINISAQVLDPSNASFDGGSDQDSKSIDFGYVPLGSAARTSPFSVHNLVATAGYTAALDLDSVTASGDTARLSTTAAPFANLAAGSQHDYVASLDSSVAGVYSATHTLAVSDEDIPGAASGPSLVLTTTARVFDVANFPVTGFMYLPGGEDLTTGPMSIAAGVTLTKPGPATLHVDGAQSHGSNATLVMTGGELVMDTDAGGNGSFPLDVQLSNSGTFATFNSPQHLRNLSLGSSTSATVAAGGVSQFHAQTLWIAPDAKLDLNDNDLVVENAAFSDIQDLVLAGYRDHTDPAATGIVSSTSQNAGGKTILLLFDNSLAGATDWPAGSGDAIGAGAIVGKYTYFGDTNLDGQVTGDDYGAIDANLGTTGIDPGIAVLMGDTNFDDAITGDDYAAVDANLGLGVGAPLGVAVVPEPDLGALAIGLAWCGISRRRRRHGSE